MAQSSNIPTTWDDNLTTWDDRLTITAAGAQSTIGTIDVSTGGVGTFSGAGSNALVAGDRLRMTAVTIGGSLANVGITIQVTRR